MSLSTAVLIAQTFIMAAGAYIAYNAIRESRKTAKQLRTTELMLRNPESNELRDAFDLLRTCNTTEQFATKDKRSDPEAIAIRRLLNYYENLAIGVKHGIYDFDIIKDTNKSNLKSVWRKCRPFIERMRSEFNNNDLYVEFEQLVSRINHDGVTTHLDK